MSVVILVAWGGFIGWVAGGFLGTDSGPRLAFTVVVGVVGAFLGAWLLGSMTEFSISGLFSALIGSLALLGVAKVAKVI